MIRRAWILCMVGWMFAGVSAQAAEPAELIYYGGEIITVDDKNPGAEAVAVRQGRIVAVGKKADVLTHQGAGTKLVNLDGKTMVPGFLDPHSHFMGALVLVNWANISAPPVGPVTDIPGIIHELKRFADRVKPAKGEWILAYGYDGTALKERRDVTRDDLDLAFPDHPVLLLHVSGHGGVLNSMGFKNAGIGSDTQTPAGGVIVRKAGSNEPAGLMMETAFAPILAHLPRPTDTQLLASLKPAQEEYARNGYTTVQEGATSFEEIQLLRKGASEGRLFLDVVSLPIFTEAERLIGKPAYPFGSYDRRLKLGGMKIITDGSPQGRTAFWTRPLRIPGPAGQTRWRGEPSVSQEQLTSLFRRAYEYDIQVYSHANGDAAIDMVIEAHRTASGGDTKDRRPVVVHSQFVREDQLDSFVRYHMFPSLFTNHAFFWGDVYLESLDEPRASYLSPMHSAEKKGLRFSNHTDFFVTPLNAMFTVWTAVNRTARSGRVIGPEERVAPLTALKALTIHAAHQYFEENHKGSIEVGKLADLVILDRNPIRIDPKLIKDIKVVETIKEGVTVYRQTNS